MQGSEFDIRTLKGIQAWWNMILNYQDALEEHDGNRDKALESLLKGMKI